MVSELEAIIDSIVAGNTVDVKLHQICDKMFVLNDEKKEKRFGLHLSELTAPFKGKTQMCFRQHVLGRHYEPVEHQRPMPVKSLRIFLEGWYVHLKWQRLFRESGRAVEIENTRLDPIWGIYHTPDIIAKFPELTKDELWIIEIKSMSHASYQKALEETDPLKIHPGGYKQSQMYMYLVGCKKAMLLLEDKDNQEHREVSFDYDPDFVASYVHRLNILSQLWPAYDTENKVPPRVCSDSNTSRAVNCPMAHVCWVAKPEREKYRLKDVLPTLQINASLIHREADEKNGN